MARSVWLRQVERRRSLKEGLQNDISISTQRSAPAPDAYSAGFTRRRSEARKGLQFYSMIVNFDT